MLLLLIFQLFINNEFVNSVSGKTFPCINPVNLQKTADIQEGDKVRPVFLILCRVGARGEGRGVHLCNCRSKAAQYGTEYRAQDS